VEGLLFTPVLAATSDGLDLPEDIRAAWQGHAMMTLTREIQTADMLHTELAQLEAAGVRAVVLKGLVLKALYPEPDMRTMSDADLLVAAADFEAAKALLVSDGFTGQAEECTDAVFVCGNAMGLRIELHQRLFDEKRQGFLARLEETALFPLSLAQRRAVYGGEAWVFPPTEHLLFMLLHMAKHMIVTGFGMRQVCDFSLFIERYDAEVDWARFDAVCRDLALEGFCAALLALCARYLALPDLRWRTVIAPGPEFVLDALLTDLLDAGVFGKSTQERTRSAAVVYRAFDRASDSRWARLRAAVFVRPSELKAPYLYAKRRPWLLPAAWVHRGWRFLFHREGGVAATAEASGGLRVAQERLDLLDRLGMRE
jgi:hypothetical protein